MHALVCDVLVLCACRMCGAIVPVKAYQFVLVQPALPLLAPRVKGRRATRVGVATAVRPCEPTSDEYNAPPPAQPSSRQ